MILMFCAPVVSFDDAYQTVPLPAHVVADLAGLTNPRADDKLAVYLEEEEPSSLLHALPITDGTLSMTLRDEQLHMCATYTVAVALTPAQLGALRDYTESHFSDGAGEGWKQTLWNRNQVNLEILWQQTALAAP